MADRTVRTVVTANVAGFTAAMAKAEASAKQFAKETEKAIADNDAQISTLSNSMGGIGLAVGAGVAGAVKSFANFDQAMSNVAASGDDARANLDALREAAIDAGATTAFSASEAAEGIENLAKAGVTAQDTLGGGLQGALDLAAAGQISVADASETAATALTQFGLAGSDVPHIADLLAAAAGKAQGEVGDMAGALKQSGLVAAQFGLSIEDTTGTLAAFASAGLLGSDAGTSFKTMLLALANPSKESAETMQQLGIAAYDANGAFVGISDLSEQLKTRLAGLSEEQRNAALSTIFGSDAIRAANVLYQQGGAGIDNWVKSVDDAGFASETAATKLDNLNGDLDALSGALETAFIRGGTGTNDVLRQLTQGATDLVNGISGIPGPALSVGVGLAAVSAAALLTTAGVGRLSVAVVQNRAAMAQLATQSPRTAAALSLAGKAAVGAGAAFAGLVIAGQVLESFRDPATIDGIDQIAGSLNTLASGSAAAQGALDIAFTRTDSSGKISELAGGVTDLASAFQFMNSLDVSIGAKVGYKMEDAIAGIAGMNSQLDAVSGRFKEIDQALTGLDDAKAGAAFAEIARQAQLAGVPAEKLIALFPRYAQGLQNQAKELDVTTLSAQDYVDWMGGKVPDAITQAQVAADDDGAFTRAERALNAMQQAGEQATVSLGDLAAAIKDAGGEAEDMDSTAIRVADALRDARDAAKENGDAFSLNSEKGGANRAALISYSEAIKDNAAAMLAAGESADTVRAKVKDQRADFIAVARSMGASKKQANDLADAYGLIPGNVKTDVSAPGAIDAEKQTEDFEAAIKDLPDDVKTKVKSEFERGGITAAYAALAKIAGKTVKTYVRTEYNNGGTGENSAGGGSAQTGRAYGGPIPGFSPHIRADNQLIRATAGEFMQDVPAVDFWGKPFMYDVLHQDVAAVRSRLDGMQALAYGGPVGPIYSGPSYYTGPTPTAGAAVADARPVKIDQYFPVSADPWAAADAAGGRVVTVLRGRGLR